MTGIDAHHHVRGETQFLDDFSEPAGLLYACACCSTIACGRITTLDIGPAQKSPGVVRVFTARDIPGQNQIGGIIQDEPLLTASDVHYWGQPIACVVAHSTRQAECAARKITLAYDCDEPVFDPEEAARLGSFIIPPRFMNLGDVDRAWPECDSIVQGQVETGAQEHLYLETQAAMALIEEKGTLHVYSSTQSPTGVQRTIARVLGLTMTAVEVEVRRLGGAFGGKEDQATAWAAMAALAAFSTGHPVKMVLSRQEDLRYTGKRHPYRIYYRLGLSRKGRIKAYEVRIYQNAGAAADLSPAILERSMFHVTNAYDIPNVRLAAYSCRTNLPPFTAFRGFGAPQAIFAMEAALDHAAQELGLPRTRLQRMNLLRNRSQFPYGMRVTRSRARQTFSQALERFHFKELQREIAQFNRSHDLHKRGLAVTPICFGISFTNTRLNQAGALVHVYTDGSVRVSTGAVEMGQGVNTKIVGIVAQTLGISSELVAVSSTSTSRVANSSPTAASTGADMNGAAARRACQQIIARLKDVARLELGEASSREIGLENGLVSVANHPTSLTWNDLVGSAYARRVNLSAQAHYATPRLFFDKTMEKGEPFAYHVFGTAITEVSLDCLRGTYTIDRVEIVHDAGRSLNEAIDHGQIEGALIQGIGWLTLEEVVYAGGRLVTDTLGTYKIPDLLSVPEITIHLLEDADNPHAVLHSKAIGEPPFLYGIGTYFALRDAIRSYRAQPSPLYQAPLTPERVFSLLHRPQERLNDHEA
ncbi:molybdopterin-dependent oxidoreductase [bacterium]|nr:molybdopterin-dependent oxidoreductase [bacterium]